MRLLLDTQVWLWLQSRPERVTDDVRSQLADERNELLHVARLPRRHGDPFDRLLVAQAQVEKLTIVTADEQIRRYDVEALFIPG